MFFGSGAADDPQNDLQTTPEKTILEKTFCKNVKTRSKAKFDMKSKKEGQNEARRRAKEKVDDARPNGP